LICNQIRLARKKFGKPANLPQNHRKKCWEESLAVEFSAFHGPQRNEEWVKNLKHLIKFTEESF
jgi:hypothetical protein